MPAAASSPSPAPAAAPIDKAHSSIQRRLMATLFSAQSVSNAAQSVGFTTLPLAAVFLTGSESTAGLPATITLVGRALIAFPIGWLMDKIGRRLGISIGLLSSVVGASLSAVGLLMGSFALFLTGALVNGFGRGAGEQSRYAAADIVPPDDASKAIGTVVFAGTIGAVLGPLLIGPSQRATAARGMEALSGPYILAGALSFVAFALVFLFLRPEPITLRQKQAAAQPVPEAARTQRQIFADPQVQLAVLALAISQLVMTLIMVITPLHMDHEHHSIEAISWTMMAHTLGMFAFSGVVGRLVARYGPNPIIIAGALVLAVSAILAPLSTALVPLAVSLFLLGLGWNLGFVAGSALLAAAVTGSERGRTQGISETIVAVAAASGSFGTGPAFQWGGYLAVSMVGLALSLALLAAQRWSRRPAALPAVEPGD